MASIEMNSKDLTENDTKHANQDEHQEKLGDSEDNLIYNDLEEEPELHARTIIACAAIFTLVFVQVYALASPPFVLPYIGASLQSPETQIWIPNALSLATAVLGPVLASASDAFQARKVILLSTCVIAFIGAAIAPGSQSIGRLIAAQTLIGVGGANSPLAYSVPSEILPRKWRPAVQSCVNNAAGVASIAGPLIIGAMTSSDPVNGWRDFYWIQVALWGLTTIGILFAYRPPKRHTQLDHLSFWKKIQQLDLFGLFLLTAGLVLFLISLNLGGGQYTWSDGRVLGTLISGIAVLIAFGIYEWKGTTTGFMPHELFRGGEGMGRSFAICMVLIFVEGIQIFSIVIFYPQLTTALFETNPFRQVVRVQPFWVADSIVTLLYGYWSTRLRSLRPPLAVGFTLFTAGLVGLATIEPGQSTNALVFSGLAGLGFGSPLALIIAAVHLAVPHHLIATATALITSSRAVAATIFTASYTAAYSNRAARLVPQDVAPAALGAGLPSSSLQSFIAALSANNQTELAAVRGVNSAIVSAGTAALKQAMADSIRVVYIIAAPFGAAAVIACYFLGNLSKFMDYRVDAPVERLRAKRKK